MDGLAFDKLHDEVGQAVFGRAAVEQAGDVRVVERGEDLASLRKRRMMKSVSMPRLMSLMATRF
jgi:hypothetical protein